MISQIPLYYKMRFKFLRKLFMRFYEYFIIEDITKWIAFDLEYQIFLFYVVFISL